MLIMEIVVYIQASVYLKPVAFMNKKTYCKEFLYITMYGPFKFWLLLQILTALFSSIKQNM